MSLTNRFKHAVAHRVARMPYTLAPAVALAIIAPETRPHLQTQLGLLAMDKVLKTARAAGKSMDKVVDDARAVIEFLQWLVGKEAV